MWVTYRQGDLLDPSDPLSHLTQVTNPSLLIEVTSGPLGPPDHLMCVTYLKHLAHLTYEPADPLSHPTVQLDPPGQSEVSTKKVQ